MVRTATFYFALASTLLFASSAFLLHAPSAFALGISIIDVRSTGVSTTNLEAGDRITIDLALENSTQEELYALGIVAYGYDEDRNDIADSGLAYVGGDVADSFFNTIDFMGTPVGGFDVGAAWPYESSIGFEVPPDPNPGRDLGLFVRAIAGVSLTPIDGDGSIDIGVDGRRISEGDAHLRLVFEATEVASTSELVLNFGIGDPTLTNATPTYGEIAFGPDGRFPFDNAQWRVRIQGTAPIPEPSAALLFASALLATASFGGHRRQR